ncbi:hypothetical protein FQN49_000033 [Arthroderma sp. PD_2]|nr:hypothetical protein FQN49_000033 [Arthroderma sp. PD_2]
MELDDWIPDIVVGVDFGMTCTEWPSPKTIQHWPGKLFSELANKVPTQIAYYQANGTDFQSWGFQCELGDNGVDVKEYFKLHLYPHHRDAQPDAPSRQEALMWFRDYTRCIYEHVVSYFASTFPNFDSQRVEFIYSVPTTWKDPRMSAEIVQYIHVDSPNHKVVIGLTEAEAAAVYACKQNYQKDDVILVCDAGGGTTDVNVLKLLSTAGEPIRLEPLDFVEGSEEYTPSKLFTALNNRIIGKPIGSVFIDKSVHQLLSQNLEKIRQLLPDPPRVVAWRMLSGRFERFKCSFGTDATWIIPSLKLDVPCLNPGSDYPDAGIHNSQMSISRQLAVVEGLVIDRIQKLKQGVVAFGSRVCRASYGIICDRTYDPQKDVGEPVRYDERDKTTYVLNQIDWLIIQGNPIPPTGVSKRFQKKLDPMELDRPWKVKFVMSIVPPQELPRSMSHGDVKTVCEIDIFMDGVDKKPKNHRWYNFKSPYWMTKVIVKVVLGPADLQFQLWNKDGRRIKSSKHEPIRVKWEPILQEMEG